MKKIVSIILAMFTILSTMIVCVGAADSNDTQTTPISLTVYDPETGEETIETYQIDSNIIATLSSKNHEITSSSVSEQTLSLLSGDSEFTDIGLSKVSNTTIAPYSPIGLFKITKELNIIDSYGTAFMISDNVAVTAAHNLYNKKKGKWYTGGYFYPGKHGSGIGNDAYGMSYAKKWAVCTQYIENTDKNLNKCYDWGAFVLKDPIGKKCGKLNLSSLSDAEIHNANLMTAGYPQYRDSIGTIINYCQYKQQMITSSVTPNYFTASVDCFSGQSGSPVFINNTVCGIVTARATSGSYSVYTRINDSAYAYLMQYAADNA